MECQKISKTRNPKNYFKDGMSKNEMSKTGNPKNYFEDGMSEN